MRKLRARPPRFVSVDNRAVDDLRLSVLDVGLLTVALRCPDGYDFTVADLTRKRRPGPEALTKAMRTLVACGYVVKLTIQDAASLTWRTEFSVVDIPFSQDDVVETLQNVSVARGAGGAGAARPAHPAPRREAGLRKDPVAAAIRVFLRLSAAGCVRRERAGSGCGPADCGAQPDVHVAGIRVADAGAAAREQRGFAVPVLGRKRVARCAAALLASGVEERDLVLAAADRARQAKRAPGPRQRRSSQPSCGEARKPISLLPISESSVVGVFRRSPGPTTRAHPAPVRA